MSYWFDRWTLVLSKRGNLKSGTSHCLMKCGVSVVKSSYTSKENRNSGSISSFLRVKYKQQIQMFWTLCVNWEIIGDVSIWQCMSPVLYLKVLGQAR